MKISILGSGLYASSLSNTLNSEHEYLMWSIDPDQTEHFNKTKQNNILKKFTSKFTNNVRMTTSLKETVEFSDIIIICIPSKFVTKTLHDLFKLVKKPIILINGSKGFLPDVNKPIGAYISDHPEYKEKIREYYTIAGGSFADDILNKNLIHINLVGKNLTKTAELAKLLSGNSLCLDPSKNVNAAELSSTLKNIYAILSGMMDYYYPDSFSSKCTLLVMSFSEIKKIVEDVVKVDVNMETSFGLGDIALTLLSSNSRNFQTGQLIAKYNSLSRAVKEISEQKITSEGLDSCSVVKEFLESENINPKSYKILNILISILIEEKQPDLCFNKVFKNN